MRTSLLPFFVLLILLASGCIKTKKTPVPAGPPPAGLWSDTGEQDALQPVMTTPEAIPIDSTGTSLPTLSLTVIPDPISLPALPSAGLYGTVFFDHNGNGIQDGTEPGIASARICADSGEEMDCTLSIESGDYKIDLLNPGDYKITLESPGADPKTMFRYIMLPVGEIEIPAYYVESQRVSGQVFSGVTVTPVSQPIEFHLEGQTNLDIALSQGYLTDPFACRDRERITETHGFDLDPNVGSVRDYLGQTSMEFTSSGRLADNHRAIDWGNNNRNVIGLPVRAAAPGIVTFVGEDYTKHGNCRMVTLAHPDTGHRTGYVHLDKILVNDRQEVQRGQILGTLGDSCTDWPHLHFTFSPGWEADFLNMSPYRDTMDPESFTWWTVDNEPVCLEVGG